MLNRRIWLAYAGLALFAGCAPTAKPKGDPYEKVQVGMTEKQVLDIMGKPVKQQRVTGGEGGPGSERLIVRWMDRHRIMTITFMHGAVIGKEMVK